MIIRLKIKFVCINMLIVALMLTVIFGMVLHITAQNMEQQSLRMMQSLHDHPVRRDPMGPEGRLPHLVIIVSENDIIKVESVFSFEEMDDEKLYTVIQRIREKKGNSGALRDLDLRYSRKVTPMGEQIVFVDMSMERFTMTDLIKTCLQIGGASFCLFFAISVGLAHWAIRPVEEAWKQQKQFVADASHELKTPLTVIMTNAELLQDEGFTDEQRTQFTKSIHVMSRQMRGLVEGLLNLARVDNGIIRERFQDVDFSEVILDGLLPFEPLFFEKGIDLQSDIHEGLRVQGSRTHLKQVLEILLDNASKYAETESTVSVTLEKQSGHCLLKVSSFGEEISKEDLKNIFKRFYRIDKARSMNHSYGLGLSIAQAIVQEHKGKIWAESRDGINTFLVQLPILRIT